MSGRSRRARRARRLAPLALRRRARCSASATASSMAARSTRGPTLVTPEVLDDLRALIPLAPLHQPYNLAAIEAVAERLPGVPQVACFDTELPSRSARPWPSSSRCHATSATHGVQRYGFHGLSYEYIASVLPTVAPRDRRRARDRRAPGQRREPLRDARRQERRQHARLHGARRALHGHASRRCSIRASSSTFSRRSACRREEVEAILYKKSGPARHLGHQQRHARSARAATSLARGWRSTTSSIAPRRKSARWRRCSAASTRSCSPPASARTPRRSAAGSVRPRRGSASRSIADANARGDSRISSAGSRVSAWVIPTNEELMIARHTAVLLGLVEVPA